MARESSASVGIVFHEMRSGKSPPRMALNRAYLSGIEDAGAIPRVLPTLRNLAHLRTLYRDCDALMLPGGPDVEPIRYGEKIDATANVTFNRELDSVELQLLDWALADRMPVLGVCRGMQLINVALGGTLWQDLAQFSAVRHHESETQRDLLAHDLRIVPGSLLHWLIGVSATVVNSMHHQGVRDVAPSLVVSADSEDGLVEGLELPDRAFFLGVQCHPEELIANAPWARGLFRGLVDAASDFRGAVNSTMLAS